MCGARLALPCTSEVHRHDPVAIGSGHLARRSHGLGVSESRAQLTPRRISRLHRRAPAVAVSRPAKCETDIVYGAGICLRLGPCTRSGRRGVPVEAGECVDGGRCLGPRDHARVIDNGEP